MMAEVEEAADQGRGHETDTADHSSPKLSSRKPLSTIRCIVDGRTHAASVGDYLADGHENAKRDRVPQTQNPVKPSSVTDPADRGKHCFPWRRIVIEPASCSIEFNRQRDARRNTGSQAEEETQAEAVADAKDKRVRYRAGD